MTTNAPTCDCGQPLRDNGTICDTCLDNVSEALTHVSGRQEGNRWIPGVAEDLEMAITRQTRFGGGDGRGTGERPVPFDPRASERLWSLKACLVGWVRIVAEGRTVTIDCPATAEGMSAWLLPHVMWLRTHEHAPEFVDEITDEVRQARRVVDRPADRWYAGPCQEPVEDQACDGELYARPGARWVDCVKCGAKHDVAERREWLLREAEDVLAHAELIGRALCALGESVTPDAIGGYKRRGKIAPHGKDSQGRDLFRVGDVIDAARDARSAGKGRRVAT